MKTVDLIEKYRRIFGTDYTQDANCQAAWLFREGSGVTVADSSQNSNVGNFKGDGEPAWDGADVPTAYTTYSVSYDGIDDYINCGNHASLNFTGDLTWIFWAKPHPGQYFIMRGAYQNGGYWIQSGAVGQEIMYIRPQYTGGGYNADTGYHAFVDDAWAHFAVSLDGTNAHWFIDGVNVTNPLCGYAGTIVRNLMLQGGYNYGLLKLTETAAFNRELDSTEINDVMDNGLTGVPPANPYPTALLQKDVISGYHCFMNAYMKAKIESFDPLKLPDGTIF